MIVNGYESKTKELKVDECSDVRFLEHVQSVLSLKTKRRGNIEISLTSPSGTKSKLLSERNRDNSNRGFHVSFNSNIYRSFLMKYFFSYGLL